MKILFILITLSFSCTNTYDDSVNTKALDEIVYNYINMFNSQGFKGKEFLLRVDIDSGYNEYDIYKIHMTPNLLSNYELPNKIDSHEGIKIAYFTKSMTSKVSISRMRGELSQRNFYREDSSLYRYHYPEWLVLKNKLDGNLFLFKDSKSE
ncbi:hypothetical protein [Fulvivirga sediminis]|uniref:Uncharacterized protein n=1 Tax=Fulvivirga sediminis TaxID=2803949 RepID=A0A937F546_9BACT|nr:hypothetical protein [Fulvivirga sediminis]MBL3655186.1 hypothetical protein [Fulvivirga sediminis]